MKLTTLASRKQYSFVKHVAFQKALDELSGMLSKMKTAAGYFIDPVLLVFCLAAGVRNGAGVVWSYNVLQYFDQYQPGVNVSGMSS